MSGEVASSVDVLGLSIMYGFDNLEVKNRSAREISTARAVFLNKLVEI